MGKNREPNKENRGNDYGKKEKFGETESNFKNFLTLLQTLKIFQTQLTFSHDSNALKLFILLNKPQLCLPLFTFVNLSTFVQMTHLWTNFEPVFFINHLLRGSGCKSRKLRKTC